MALNEGDLSSLTLVRMRSRRYVFNVDIQDFFGSINFGRVRGYFIADKNFQLRAEVATVLAQIACFENTLPQGSPCSPIISNLIGHIVDIHVVKLCERCRLHVYKVCRRPHFFHKQANVSKTDCDAKRRKRTLLVTRKGTIPRNCKMRVRAELSNKRHVCSTDDSRQEVTGLIVNSKINV